METKQCAQCRATMDAAKAFCSDCGSPMDEEQKRIGSSEHDAFAQTMDITRTGHLRMLDEINLLAAANKKSTPEAATPISKPVLVPTPVAPTSTPSIVQPPPPKINVDLTTPVNGNGAAKTKPDEQIAVAAKPHSNNQVAVAATQANADSIAISKKTLYIGGAAILVLLLLFAIVVALAVGYFMFAAR